MEEIATVYARSLFEAAQDAGSFDTVREQIGEFADALSENRDLQVFFFSPYLTTEDKKEGLHKAISDADDLVGNFLDVLIENHRMPVLFKIRQELDALWDAENQRLPVEITSAVELDDATVDRIGKQIGEQTGQQIEITAKVDPDILGDLVIRVGNTVLDASVRNRLDQLRKEVARAA